MHYCCTCRIPKHTERLENNPEEIIVLSAHNASLYIATAGGGKLTWPVPLAPLAPLRSGQVGGQVGQAGQVGQVRQVGRGASGGRGED